MCAEFQLVNFRVVQGPKKERKKKAKLGEWSTAQTGSEPTTLKEPGYKSRWRRSGFS